MLTRRGLAEEVQQRQLRVGVPRRRPRSVGTKVTDEEYALIAQATGDAQSISEWVRGALLAAATSEPADCIIVAELLALRAILLTLHFAVAAGETLTTEAMQRLIDRADADKLLKAQDRLAQRSTRGRS